jgi:hypothetical protein
VPSAPSRFSGPYPPILAVLLFRSRQLADLSRTLYN